MNQCAIQISGNCTKNIHKRGICSNCWKKLISLGIIEKGQDYPQWLKDFIKIEDAFDGYSRRRSHEESLEEYFEREF